VFDIGFSELVLVFVIGLIVLGPQRLPVAVKTVVGWIRAIRSLAANVQHELAQELKQSMEELRKTADSMKRSVQQSIDIEKAEDEANTIHQPAAVKPDVPPAAAAVTPAQAEHHASAPAQAPAAAETVSDRTDTAHSSTPLSAKDER